MQTRSRASECVTYRWFVTVVGMLRVGMRTCWHNVLKYVAICKWLCSRADTQLCTVIYILELFTVTRGKCHELWNNYSIHRRAVVCQLANTIREKRAYHIKMFCYAENIRNVFSFYIFSFQQKQIPPMHSSVTVKLHSGGLLFFFCGGLNMSGKVA